jgi:lipopolysaccharide/colanic/teichoic acid biosynthesis glycosyltransferase
MSPLKRTLDVTAALAGLIILTPVLIVVAILVGITSKGPVLFR